MAAITAKATFDGTTDTVTATYSGVTATVPDVICGGATTSGGPVDVYVFGDPTSTSCVVKASSAFTGSVNLIVVG